MEIVLDPLDWKARPIAEGSQADAPSGGLRVKGGWTDAERRAVRRQRKSGVASFLV